MGARVRESYGCDSNLDATTLTRTDKKMIERWAQHFDRDLASATPMRTVQAYCDLHDFHLSSVYLDVDFRNDAYLLLKVPPTLLSLNDEVWVERWPNALAKLPNLRSLLCSELQQLDQGPAQILDSAFTTNDGEVTLTMTISPNAAMKSFEPDLEIRLGFSFDGEATVVLFS